MTLHDDAIIPIAGRFQRIENTLARIEEKLDLKANIAEVSRIDTRVLALENGTAPGSQRLTQEFFQAQSNITSLQLENSKNLPLLAMIPDLENRVTSLESRTQTTEAVKTALETSQSNSRQLKFAIIGIITSVITSLGAMTVQIIKALHG